MTPRHHWKLNDPAGLLLDQNGGALLTPTGTTVVDGRRGKCRSFTNNTTDKLVPDAFSKPTTEPFSVSCWVKIAPIASGSRAIFTVDDGGSGRAILFGADNSWGLFAGLSGDGSAVTWVYGNDRIDDSAWHHVALVRSSTTAAIYIDGVQSAISAVMPSSIFGSSAAVRIGASYENAQSWGGLLEDCRYYDHALSQGEIVQLYNPTTIAKITGRRVNADSNTVGLWRLDHTSGTTASDVSVQATVYPLTCTDTTPVTGITDKPFTIAQAFNGTSSMAQDAAYRSIHNPSNPTVEAWVKMTEVPGASSYCVASCRSAALGNALFVTTDAKAQFWFGGVTSSNSITGLTTLVADTWYHLRGTYNGSVLKVYVNGVLDASLTVSLGAASAHTNPLTIGRQSHSASSYFKGQIADARLSNTARTPMDAYNVVSAVKDPQVGFAAEPGKTIACFNFDNDAGNGAAGSTVIDDAGLYDGVVRSAGLSVISSPVGACGAAKALSSDGAVNRGFDTPASYDFDFSTDRTVELWFKLNSVAATSHVLQTQTGNPQLDIYFTTTNTALVFWLSDSGGTSSNAQATGLAADRLYYAACTYIKSTKTMTIYLDGVFKGSTVGTFNSANMAASRLVRAMDAAGAGLNGSLYALRFSHGAKTAKEIYDAYMGSNIYRRA